MKGCATASTAVSTDNYQKGSARQICKTDVFEVQTVFVTLSAKFRAQSPAPNRSNHPVDIGSIRDSLGTLLKASRARCFTLSVGIAISPSDWSTAVLLLTPK